MSVELAVKEKVVGLKQVRRALHQHTARRVYLACDADPRLIPPLRELWSPEGAEPDATRPPPRPTPPPGRRASPR